MYPPGHVCRPFTYRDESVPCVDGDDVSDLFIAITRAITTEGHHRAPSPAIDW